MTSFKDISYFNAEHLLVIVTLYWLVYWDSKELTVNSGRGDGEGLTSLRAEVKRLNILLVSIAIVVTDNSRCSGLGQ